MNASTKFEITQKYILSIINRNIPGAFNNLHEVTTEPLQDLGFDFSTAVALPPTDIAGSLLVGGKAARKLINSMVENEDSWHFSLADRSVSSADGLHIAVWTRNPHAIVSNILDSGALKSHMALKAYKDGHFIIMTALALKSLAKCNTHE